MADPLSISASILAIIGAANISLEFIKAARNGLKELDAVMNEVSDFTIVCREVDTMIREHQQRPILPQDTVAGVAPLLHRARDAAVALNDILQKKITPRSGSSRKSSRLSWIREKGNMQAALKNLRESRINLATALATFTSSNTSRIEVVVRDIQVTTQNYQLEALGFHDSILSALERGQRTQDFVGKALLLYLVYQIQQEVRGQSSSEISAPGLSISSMNTRLLTTPAINLDSSTSISTNTPGDGRRQGLRIQVSQHSSYCQEGCQCLCHHKSYYTTPRILKRLLGSLFIGYSGAPTGQSCDEAACQRRQRRWAYVTYHFPQWLITERMLVIMLDASTWNGPEYTLRMPRIVRTDSAVFVDAARGNTQGLKFLFEKGIASPSDVAWTNEYTPLHYAVESNRLDTCKFLLQNGADPTMLNTSMRSPLSMAWTTILKGRFDFQPDLGPRDIEFLRSLFAHDDIIEERRFTTLHQIVINLRVGNIEHELQKPESKIDAVDAQGKTALVWAAQRGNTEAVKLLLDHGADPNVPTKPDQQLALNYSCIPPTTECLKLLLEPRVRAKKTPNSKGWTALHIAAHYHDNPEFLRILLANGFDIEARTARGRTPLASAAERNNTKAVKYLIQQGANIDVRDEEGYSPLFLAVSWGSISVTRVLLRFNPDYRHKTRAGSTILHCAATTPKLDMLQLLGFGMTEVDASLPNDVGLTAREVLLQKKPSGEIVEEFDNLLRTISTPSRNPSAPEENISQESEEEVELTPNMPGMWP